MPRVSENENKKINVYSVNEKSEWERISNVGEENGRKRISSVNEKNRKENKYIPYYFCSNNYI